MSWRRADRVGPKGQCARVAAGSHLLTRARGWLLVMTLSAITSGMTLRRGPLRPHVRLDLYGGGDASSADPVRSNDPVIQHS